MYGIDWDGPVTGHSNEAVTHKTSCPYTTDMDELTAQVSPLAESENYGVDIYLDTLAFVMSKVFNT